MPKFTALALAVCLAAPGFAQLKLDPRLPFKGMPRGDMKEIVPGQILVKLTQDKAAQLASAPLVGEMEGPSIVPGGRFRNRIAQTGWTLWLVPESTDVRALARRVKLNPEVAYAQPVNKIYPLYTDPNDPDFDYEETNPDYVLDLNDEGASFRRMWHLTDISAELGWADYPNVWYTAATKPRNAPLIAIVDTGVDMDHPDFINAGGTSSDVPLGGQLQKSLSKQFRFGEIDPGGTPEDEHGHGTHVAGIAVSAGNSGPFSPQVDNGVLGIGYNSRAMILRVFDSAGSGSDADAAAAIFYAADNKADIINLSIGTENYSQLFQDAVTYAFQKGSLVVAAGNEDGNGGGDLGPIYPAANSGALGVSANGPDRIPATGTYSGFGAYVDIAAPGGDVYFAPDLSAYKIQFVWSTAMRTPGTLWDLSQQGALYPPYDLNYAYLAGTSMASPMVAGAAGQYYGKFNLRQTDGGSNIRAYRMLEFSAEGVMGAPNGAWEPYQGYGSLDLFNLLTETNARGALVGAIEGIVYYNATPIANVQVRATKGGVNYSTTTAQDGTYRFDQLPPGVYSMQTAPFGALKTKKQIVKAGSDSTNTDFWAGTFTWDTTPPTVLRFELPRRPFRGALLFTAWGYDTESSIDAYFVRIGRTAGASDVLPWTEFMMDGNRTTVAGITFTPGRYFVAIKYRNGAGLETVKELRMDAF